jgi:hypothetical protein
MGKPLVPGRLLHWRWCAEIRRGGNVCYTITSRGIGVGNDGNGQAYAIQVEDLPLNGSASKTLPARDIAVYRVVVPANTPGWMLKLVPDAGQEAALAVGLGGVPNIDANPDFAIESSHYEGVVRERSGADYYYRFAKHNDNTDTDDEFLEPATYYAVVESEGASRIPVDRVGSGSAHYTLTSAVMPYTDVTADPLDNGETKSWSGKVLPYGRCTYTVSGLPLVLRLWISESRIRSGMPYLFVEKAATGVFRFPNVIMPEGELEIALSQDRRNSGYERDFSNKSLVTVPAPTGDYWVLVTNEYQSDPAAQAGMTWKLQANPHRISRLTGAA